MKILFEIGGLSIHFFGVMIALGILAGFFVIYKEAARKKMNVNKIIDLAIYTLISGVVGARLGYIVFYNFDFYLQNPGHIFMVQTGGLSIHGALAGGTIFGFWYIKKHGLRFWQIADIFAPALILGQAIGRIGCDVFGRVMTIPRPWGVVYQGQLVHPVQVYEFLLNYLVFLILWRKRSRVNYNGQLFVWYIILFSINRGIVEFFRVNPTILGLLSVSHFLSLLFILGAGIAAVYLKKQPVGKDKKQKETGKTGLLADLLLVLLLSVVSIAIYYLAWF